VHSTLALPPSPARLPSHAGPYSPCQARALLISLHLFCLPSLLSSPTLSSGPLPPQDAASARLLRVLPRRRPNGTTCDRRAAPPSRPIHTPPFSRIPSHTPRRPRTPPLLPSPPALSRPRTLRLPAASASAAADVAPRGVIWPRRSVCRQSVLTRNERTRPRRAKQQQQAAAAAGAGAGAGADKTAQVRVQAACQGATDDGRRTHSGQGGEHVASWASSLSARSARCEPSR